MTQRRKIQFSLRMLIGAFTILACLSAIVGYCVKIWNGGAESRRMMRMNELILNNGGYWEVGTGLSLPKATKTQLDSVLKELEAFDGQTSMYFPDSEFSDSHAKAIVCHHGLTSLVLDNTLVTDDGVKSLSTLGELVCVQLDNTAITDAGLEHLSKLPKLQYLHVSDTKVTEEGIEKLKLALPNLKV